MAHRLSAALLATVLVLGVTAPAFAAPADVAAFDPDKDGTLERKEYLAVVAARFKAAHPDAEATIDAKELSATAGASLVTLKK